MEGGGHRASPFFFAGSIWYDGKITLLHKMYDLEVR